MRGNLGRCKEKKGEKKRREKTQFSMLKQSIYKQI